MRAVSSPQRRHIRRAGLAGGESASLRRFRCGHHGTRMSASEPLTGRYSDASFVERWGQMVLSMHRFRRLPQIAVLVAGIAATVVFMPSPAQAADQPSTLDPTLGCTWVIKELPLPAGWRSGYVYNSDRHDSFAGYGVDADGRTRPLVWHNGDVTVLDAPGSGGAVAQDVNSRGDVIGVSQGEDTPSHGVLWRDGQVIDLPLLPGGDYAVPTAINNSGLIVGYAAGTDTNHA